MTIVADWLGIRDEIITVLASANTTTASYDLSTGLTKRINSIVKHDLLIAPQFLPKYPLVSVRLDAKTEVPEGFSPEGTFSKIANLETEIYCVYDDYLGAESSLWDMVRNVEVVLRENPRLNDYDSGGLSVNIIVVGRLEPTIAFTRGDAFNKAAKLGLRVNCSIDGGIV